MSKKKAMFFGSVAGYDADYQAILDEASSQGYTLPSVDQRGLQNQFLLDLKEAGVWSKLDILHLFTNDGSKEFGSLNWTDPTNYALGSLSNFDWTSNVGFTKNISAGGSISFNPSTDAVNFALDDNSWGYKLGAEGGNPIAASDYALNCNDGTYIIRNTNGTLCRVHTNMTSDWSFSKTTYGNPAAVDQFTVFDINGSTNKYYKDGSEAFSTTRADNALPNSNVNYADSSGSFTNEMKLIFMSAHLTATEIADFDTAIDDYLAAI